MERGAVRGTADGGAARMGASLVDGANREEETVVVRQRAQLEFAGLRHNPDPDPNPKLPAPTGTVRGAGQETADGGAAEMDASLADGANKEEGATGKRQPVAARAVRGAVPPTADGGAAEMGTSLVDGANKEEGAADREQHAKLENWKTGKLARQHGADKEEGAADREQHAKLENWKTGKLARQHGAAAAGGPEVEAQRRSKRRRPHEQVSLLEGVHKVWRRPEPHSKWLQRRPGVRLRQEHQPWLRVDDVEYGWLHEGHHEEEDSTVSCQVMQQLEWKECTVGDVVSLDLGMGDDQWVVQARVVAEATPSFVLGTGVCRDLFAGGWKVDESHWLLGAEDNAAAPTQVEDDLLLQDVVEADSEYDGEEEQELEAFWDGLVRDHQRFAVEGDEPGGLITGREHAPQQELLREVWRDAVAGLTQDLSGLPSGPAYATPADNPEEFLRKVQEFRPGEIHRRVEAWRRLDPQIDREVMDWIENGFEVPRKARLGCDCAMAKQHGSIRMLFNGCC